jgi:regulatory protein
MPIARERRPRDSLTMAARGRRREVAQHQPPGLEAAMEIAARFLATRPRSRREVELRLRRAVAAPEVVELTLDRLAALGLIDDTAFARWWLQQRDRHAPRGRRMVEAELRQHGVDRRAIEALRDELAAFEAAGMSRSAEADAGGLLEGPLSEEERARTALARHLRGRPLPEDRAAQQRIGMFLMRRGFDSETVRRALRVAEDPGPDDLD